MTNENEIDEEQEEAWDEELKHKERIFVLNYCTNEATFLNAKLSYRETYTKRDKDGKKIIPEDSTCESNGSKLSKKPKIKNAIRKLLNLTQPEKDERNIYQLLEDLAHQAFYNPAQILTASGKLKTKKLEDLGELAKCISQIKPTQYGIEYTLVDRYKAIAVLGKYLNIVRPEQQIEVKLPVVEVPSKIIDPEQWNAVSDKEE